MANNVGLTQLRKANDRLANMQNRIKKVQKRAEETTVKVVRTVEISATAFGMGVIQGKTGGIEVMGVPLDLLVGGGLNLAGYLGVAGKASDHLNAMGDGALASYATTVGRGVGATWKSRENGEPPKEIESKSVSGLDIDTAAAIASGRLPVR